MSYDNAPNDLPDPSDKFDSQVIDEGDLLNERELNINPQIYIHMAVQRSQQALLNPNLEAGMTQYVFLVQQIESISRAAGLIDEPKYKEAIATFKETQEYKDTEKALFKHMAIAQEKLRLLMQEMFNNKTSNAPLRL